MNAGAAVLANIGSDHWNAEMYESLSVASRLSALLHDRTKIFMLAFHLRRLNAKLTDIVEQLYLVLEQKDPVPAPQEPVAPDRIQRAIDTLNMLHKVLSTILDESRRRRLSNSSLLSGQISRLAKIAEDFLEFSDWLEMVFLHAEEVNKIFERARIEKEKGEVYDLSQVN